MTQQIINLGAYYNDTSADKIRTGFAKTQANFTDIYEAGFVWPGSSVPAASLTMVGQSFGSSMPIEWFQNNAAQGTAGVFLNAAAAAAYVADAIVQGITPLATVVTPSVIFIASLAWSGATGNAVKFAPRTQYLCEAPITYPDAPVFKPTWIGNRSEIAFQFDTMGANSGAAHFLNTTYNDAVKPVGPFLDDMRFSLKTDYFMHCTSGAQLFDHANLDAVSLGDWTGLNAPVFFSVSATRPLVLGNVIPVDVLPPGVVVGTGSAGMTIVNPRFIGIGSAIASVAAHGGGGYDITCTYDPTMYASAVVNVPPPHWTTSAFRVTPGNSNNIFVDALPVGFPQEYWDSRSLANPNVDPTSVVRGIGPNQNDIPWTAATAYTVGYQVVNVGQVYSCSVAGTSGTSGPWQTTGTNQDGTCQWTYLGPAGFIVMMAAGNNTYAVGASGIATSQVIGPGLQCALASGVSAFPVPGLPASCPRHWYGTTLRLNCRDFIARHCDFLGCHRGNSCVTTGDNWVWQDCGWYASDGHSGIQAGFAQGQGYGSGGPRVQGGNGHYYINPRGSSGDDFLPIGPNNSWNKKLNQFSPLQNLDISNVFVVNPDVVSWDARGIAIFNSLSNGQQQNPWLTATPITAGQTQVQFAATAPNQTSGPNIGLPAGETPTSIIGNGAYNHNTFLASNYVVAWNAATQTATMSNAALKSTMVPITIKDITGAPLNAATSVVRNVCIIGGRSRSTGTNGFCIRQDDSSNIIEVSATDHFLDMSYSTFYQGTNTQTGHGIYISSLYGGVTFRAKRFTVFNPLNDAMAVQGIQNELLLDSCRFEQPRVQPTSGANVTLAGANNAIIRGCMIWSAPSTSLVAGQALLIGGVDTFDSIGEEYLNAAVNVKLRDNTIFGAQPGIGVLPNAAIVIASATDVSLKDTTVYQFPPLGALTGQPNAPCAYQIGPTCTNVNVDGMTAYVDGNTVQSVDGSAVNYTTGINFFHPTGLTPPIVLPASAVSGLKTALGMFAQTTGSWTIGVTSQTPGDLSVAIASSNAVYTRVGNLIFIQFTITFTPTFTTASGTFALTGLPFLSANNGNSSAIPFSAPIGAFTWAAAGTMAFFNIQPNANRLNVNFGKSGAAQSALAITGLTSNTAYTFSGSGTYLIGATS